MTLPSMAEGFDRATALAWSSAIDAGPWSTLAAGERVTYRSFEPLTTLAFAAATTERVDLAVTVSVLPAHPAIGAAKQLATLDALSGGRLTVGVGVGGREQDFEALERPFARRHQTLDEQVAVMRAVWRGEAVGDLPPTGPAPTRPGGPPILASAMGPKSMARAARWADGLAGFVMDPLGAEASAAFDLARRSWVTAGRDDPPRLVTSFWCTTQGRDRLHAYASHYLSIFGDDLAGALADSCSAHSSAAIAEGIAACREAGADEVILVPITCERAELDRLEALAS